MRSAWRLWIVRFALIQLIIHLVIGVVGAQPIEELTRFYNLEGRIRQGETAIAVLQSDMFEVKWLARGVMLAMILQLVSAAGRRQRGG